MKHRLTDVQDVEISLDGRLAAMTLHSDTAPPFALEVQTEQLDQLIGQLLAIAHRAGEIEGRSPTPTTAETISAIPIPTHGVGVMLGRAGHCNLVVRIGSIDLALEVEVPAIGQLSRGLSALQTLLAQEPNTAQ